MRVIGFLLVFALAFALVALQIHLTVWAFEVIGNVWGVALLWVATSLTVATLTGRFTKAGGR